MKMSEQMTGIINVREWDTVVDMRTGYPCERRLPELARLQQLAAAYPYPGDKGGRGVRWVFDVAREIVGIRDPEWLCLNFPQPAMADMRGYGDPAERKGSIDALVGEIRSFAREYGYAVVIVGSGAMVPLKGLVKVEQDFGGIVQGTAWSKRWCGVYHAEPGDFERICGMEHVAQAFKKEDVITGTEHPNFIAEFPDVIFSAEEGYFIKALCSGHTSIRMVERQEETLPVYSEIGLPGHIEGVRALMDAALDRGQRVLLAIVEGIGLDDLQSEPVLNRRDWYTYSGYSLYYTLATGRSFRSFDLPPVNDMTRRDDYPALYPLSMPISGPCAHSIGCRPDKRTACVGSRSMVSHSVINADITAECFMRSMINMGMLVVVR